MAPIAQLLSLRGELVDSRSDGAWFFIQPFALADTPLDSLVAFGCVLLLCVIVVIEKMTPPGAVVMAFTVFPLAAGLWLLSNRFAAVVLAATVLVFVAAGIVEVESRLTFVLVAIPILAVGIIVRQYAASVRKVIALPAPSRKDPPPIAALTRRELEVARLAASAYTAAEIGQRLHIGERTVESHIASAYLKLQISSRPELIRMAERLG